MHQPQVEFFRARKIFRAPSGRSLDIGYGI